MLLAPGDRVDRYVVEEALGSGGLGTVYRAVDERLGRRIALKVLRDGAAGAQDLIAEARAAARIVHPNVIAIHDVGETGGVAYIAMELVEGTTLRAKIGDAAVSVDQRIQWLRDVALGLSAAHAQGFVHRDVKPENVMVRDDGSVKIVDFGLARAPAADAEDGDSAAAMATLTTLRRAGVAGTPYYMAPEQLRADAIDGRADQFAWGVVAYELLSGRRPWGSGSDAYTLAASILTREPKPLGALVSPLDPRVDAVVTRALRKSASERFGSFGELLAALAPPDPADSRPLKTRTPRIVWLAPVLLLAGLVSLLVRPHRAVAVQLAREDAAVARQETPVLVEPPSVAPSVDEALVPPPTAPMAATPASTASATPVRAAPTRAPRTSAGRSAPGSAESWERGRNGAPIFE